MNDQERGTGWVLKIALAACALILSVGFLVHMMSDRSLTLFNVQQCFNACERKQTQMKLVTKFSCECMPKNSTEKWIQTHREVEWVTPKVVTTK